MAGFRSPWAESPLKVAWLGRTADSMHGLHCRGTALLRRTTATATSSSRVNHCATAPSAAMVTWFASKPSCQALCHVRRRAITHELQHTIAAECFPNSRAERWSSFRRECRIHLQFLRHCRIGRKTTQRNRPKHDSRSDNQRSGFACQLLATVSFALRRDRADSIPIAPPSARWFSTTGFLAYRSRWWHHGLVKLGAPRPLG